MQMISIIDQTIALIMQLTQDAEQVAPEDKSVWYVPACSIYLGKSMVYLLIRYLCYQRVSKTLFVIWPFFAFLLLNFKLRNNAFI